MKHFFLPGFLLFLLHSSLNAQKRPLELGAYKNWPVVKYPVLSLDKQWLAYQLTDTTAIVYHIKLKTADTVAIPEGEQHQNFYFDSAYSSLHFNTLVLRAKPPRPKGPGVSVDIWSWKDSVLQSAQLYQLAAPDSFTLRSLYDPLAKTMKSGDSLKWTGPSKTTLTNVALKKRFEKRLKKKYNHFDDSVIVVGAIDKKNFILQVKQGAASNNLFQSFKFKKYYPITNIYPEKEFIWYTQRPITLPAPEGLRTDASLVLPENFDSTKKYPVILYLHDNKNGTGLYNPVYSNGIMNIPFLVSNGYIVVSMQSDIVTGKVGPSMLERVQQAGQWLQQQPWADTARLGINGHGLSAYNVNYIVTRTGMFKAASESAGVTDCISHYGSIDGKGESFQPYYDLPGTFFGKTLWDDTAMYIQQTPIFELDEITTPVLMMHNDSDMVVPFSQGIEMFTGMRRLGNRCWMLQYDGEGHTLKKPINQEDYSIRLKQFYDHYLKDMPAPIWMTRGVAYKDRGIITGLEYDTKIKTPLLGGLLKEENDAILERVREEEEKEKEQKAKQEQLNQQKENK